MKNIIVKNYLDIKYSKYYLDKIYDKFFKNQLIKRKMCLADNAKNLSMINKEFRINNESCLEHNKFSLS